MTCILSNALAILQNNKCYQYLSIHHHNYTQSLLFTNNLIHDHFISPLQTTNLIVSIQTNYNQQPSNIGPGRQMSNFPQEKKQFVNQYLAEKAGMAQVDKDKIAEIVQKLTEGSPKSLYEKEMAQKRQIQLGDLLKKLLDFTSEQKKQIRTDWQEEILKMQAERNLTKYWAHLDFDMFYVACELLDKPQISQRPVAVGGQNSVVCTANYVARKYGVRSAIPTFIAVKLCPDLVLIPPDFTKYKKYSNIFRDILRKFDKEMESMGLDQAYVELTPLMKDKSLPEQEEFINSIRQQIFTQTGLTVSCGVGANKLLAKLASEERKPNGQFILPNQTEKILEFMKTKKIRKIPGIGPVNEFFLKGLGMQTAQDILDKTDVLTICFSSNSTQFYVSRALGMGSIEHEFSQRKSLGKSETFKVTSDKEYLLQKVVEICEQVSMELQELGYVTKNVVFAYQNQMYSKKDKTFNLNKYTSSKADLVEPILPYLEEYLDERKEKVRLVGVRCTSILKVEELKKNQLDKYLMKPGEEGEWKRKEHKLFGAMLQFWCPICEKEIDCKGNLAAFNRHIDKCMMGVVEREETKQEKGKQSGGAKVKKTEDRGVVENREEEDRKTKGEQRYGNSNMLFSFLKKK